MLFYVIISRLNLWFRYFRLHVRMRLWWMHSKSCVIFLFHFFQFKSIEEYNLQLNRNVLDEKFNVSKWHCRLKFDWLVGLCLCAITMLECGYRTSSNATQKSIAANLVNCIETSKRKKKSRSELEMLVRWFDSCANTRSTNSTDCDESNSENRSVSLLLSTIQTRCIWHERTRYCRDVSCDDGMHRSSIMLHVSFIRKVTTKRKEEKKAGEAERNTSSSFSSLIVNYALLLLHLLFHLYFCFSSFYFKPFAVVHDVPCNSRPSSTLSS